jgi:hypothetical protein
MNMAMAIDMEGAPVTNDTITECSGGDEGDQGEAEEDDPVIQDTITAISGSEDNNDDNSGQSSGNNGNDDNDAERATSDVKATNEPNCTKVQEPGLFTPSVYPP